jgi:spermidine synthase
MSRTPRAMGGTRALTRPHPWLWILAAAGAAALADQVAWARAAAGATGSSAAAAAIVLASLLGGMSHGAARLGRAVDASPRPARWFARLEFGLSLAALALPWWLAVGLPGLVGELPWFLRLLATGASLWPAAFLMGGTLPASLRAMGPAADRRRWIAWAQAANGLGAAAGGALAALFGMEHLGLLGVGAVAAAVHAGTGWWAWRIDESPSTEPEVRPSDAAVAGLAPLQRKQARLVTLALFLSGVGALLLETAALRSIGLTFGGSAHAYGTMVAAFVLGLSLGSALLGWWRPRRPLVGLAWSQLAVGASVLLLTPALARLPWWAGRLRAATAPSGDYAEFLLGGFALGAGVWLLPTLFLGAAFPLTALLLSAGVEKLGRPVGGALSANALGNVVGALLGTFVVLEQFGLGGTVEVALAMHFAAACVCLLAAGAQAGRSRWALPALGLALAAAYGFGGGRAWSEPLVRGVLHLRVREDAPESLAEWKQRYVERVETVFLEEDEHLVVHVADVEGQRALFLNAKPDASTGHDLATQVLVGHLPLLFSEGSERALMVGYGAGFSAGAVLAHPVERLDVLEISPAVLEAHRAFAPFNGNALEDPRVRAHRIDAAAFLAGSEETWDAIVCQPSNPWLVGVADLYTPDFLRDLREHLAPGGVGAVWFHEYEQSERVIDRMLAALDEVFGHAELFRVHELDDVVALVWNGEPPPLDARFERLDRAFRRSEVRASLARSLIHTPVDLLSMHIGWPLDHGLQLTAGPHTRLAPKLEYEAARAFFLGASSERLRDGDPLLSEPQQSTWLDGYAERAARLGDPLTRLDWGDAIARRAWAAADEGRDPTRGWKQRSKTAPELSSSGAGGRLPEREFQRAEQLEAEGRLAAALGAYRGGLAWAPNDFEGRHGEARVLLGLERFEEAAELLDGLAGEYPEQAMVRLDQGSALDALERIDEARAAFQAAYAKLDRADLALELARWELGLPEPDLGWTEKLLGRVLRADPADVEATLLLAKLYAVHRGELDRARLVLRAGLDRRPGERALIEALARLES